MKKILFFINDLSGGGAEKALLTLIKNMDCTLYKIDILLIYHHGVYLQDLPSHIEVYSLISSHSIFSRFINLFIRKIPTTILSWFVNHKVKEEYDVIVAYLEGRSTRYVSLIRSSAIKIAWVHCDLLDFHWTQDVYRNLRQEEDTYRKMDQIIFVSANAKAQFNRLFPTINTDKQQVILNLIDQNEISQKAEELSVEKKKKTLILVGRLNLIKGLERFIAVVERLWKENLDFEVWILGNGPLEETLREMVIDKGLKEVILFKGFHKNTYSFVKNSDLFLNVSYSEGYSLTIAEALCLNKPILATRTAGSEELLHEGEFGMLVENSEEGIYNGLKQLLLDETLLANYQAKSIKGAEQFNIYETLGILHALFNNIKPKTIS